MSCDLGIKRLIEKETKDKPWFDFNGEDFVAIRTSPLKRITPAQFPGVAKTFANYINRSINKDANIGKICYVKFRGNEVGVFINPTPQQLKLLNATPKEFRKNSLQEDEDNARRIQQEDAERAGVDYDDNYLYQLSGSVLQKIENLTQGEINNLQSTVEHQLLEEQDENLPIKGGQSYIFLNRKDAERFSFMLDKHKEFPKTFEVSKKVTRYKKDEKVKGKFNPLNEYVDHIYVKSNNNKNSNLYNIIDKQTGEVIASNIRVLHLNKDAKKNISEKYGLEFTPTKVFNANRSIGFTLYRLKPSKSKYIAQAKRYLYDALKFLNPEESNLKINLEKIEELLSAFPEDMWEYINTTYSPEDSTNINASISLQNKIKFELPKLGFLQEIEKITGIPLQGVSFRNYDRSGWIKKNLRYEWKEVVTIDYTIFSAKKLRGLIAYYLNSKGYFKPSSEEQNVKKYAEHRGIDYNKLRELVFGDLNKALDNISYNTTGNSDTIELSKWRESIRNYDWQSAELFEKPYENFQNKVKERIAKKFKDKTLSNGISHLDYFFSGNFNWLNINFNNISGQYFMSDMETEADTGFDVKMVGFANPFELITYKKPKPGKNFLEEKEVFNRLAAVLHEPFHALHALSYGTEEELQLRKAFNNLYNTSFGKEMMNQVFGSGYNKNQQISYDTLYKEFTAFSAQLMLYPKEWITKTDLRSNDIYDFIEKIQTLQDKTYEEIVRTQQKIGTTEKTITEEEKIKLTFLEKLYNYVVSALNKIIPLSKKFFNVIADTKLVEKTIIEDVFGTEEKIVTKTLALPKEVKKAKEEFLEKMDELKSALNTLMQIDSKVFSSQNVSNFFNNEKIFEQESGKNTKYNQSLQEGLNWLKEVAPNVDVKILQGLINGIGRGAYDTIEDLILLSQEYADKGTIKHELGHKIFSSLPQEEKEALLEEGSKLFGIPRGESKAKIKYSLAQQNQINYTLKAISNIQDNLAKVNQWWKQIGDNDTFWKKLQTDLQIPKEQVNLLRESKGNTIEQKLASFAANYTYTVEINTAKIPEERNFGKFGQLKLTKGQIVKVKGYEGLWRTIEDNGEIYNQEDFIPSTSWDLEPINNLFDPETNPNGLDPLFNVPEDKIIIDDNYRNTQHYSNLTVPEGTNYTENEIATPLITPSIKGHAQFSTNNGIGWFRSDDKAIIETPETVEDELDLWTAKKVGDKVIVPTNKPTKTRRILEVQSDLFQKWRNNFEFEGNKYTARKDDKNVWHYYKNGNEISANEYAKTWETFLDTYLDNADVFTKLLQKDNNWVTFFVKSIIQDSAKKGYKKVLFPTGNTASKVEGHTTLEEFKKQKEDRIKELEEQSKNPKYKIKTISTGNYRNGTFSSKKEAQDFMQSENADFYLKNNPNEFEIVDFEKENRDNEINQLKQELERVETEGFGALKPIYKFYEETVANVLKKQGYNPTLITDEYGNTWLEVEVKPEHLDSIKFQSPKISYTGDLAIEEKIMELLEKSKDIPQPKTRIQKFIQKIRDFLRKIYDNRTLIQKFSDDINSGKFKELSSLKEKAEKTNSKENRLLYQLAKNNIEEEYSIAEQVNILTQGLDEHLNGEKRDKIIDLTYEYFTVISNNLKNMIKNKSYERLNKLYTGEHGVNKLSITSDTLRRADNLVTDKNNEDEVKEHGKQKLAAIAKTIVHLNYLTKLMSDDVEKLLSEDGNSHIDSLVTLQSYLNTISDYSILLKNTKDILRERESNGKLNVYVQLDRYIDRIQADISNIRNQISQTDRSAVMEALRDFMIPQGKEYIKIIEGEIELAEKNRQRYIREGKIDKAKSIENQIKVIREKANKYNFEENKNILNFLEGKNGDTDFFSTFFFAYRDSSDPIVGGFAAFARQIIDTASARSYKEDTNLLKELAPYTTTKDRIDPQSVNQKISFSDTKLVDGKKIKVLTLLNPWKDFQADYDLLRQEESEAREKFNESNSTEDEQAYLEAKEKRVEFEKDVLYQEYNQKYYDKFKLFEDPVGISLKEDIDEIFDKIRKIDERYFFENQELDEKEIAEKEALILQYKQLANIYNADHTLKEGISREKAERMQAIRAINREVYTWKDNYAQFDKAKERYSDYLQTRNDNPLSPDSLEYKIEMDKWEEKNTRTVITDQFYKDIDATVLEIQLILNSLKNKDIDESMKDLWKTIKDITYGYRDDDNQVIGTLISPRGAEKLKATQEAIEELKEKARNIGSLSLDQYDRLLFLENKDDLTQEEYVELKELALLQEKKNRLSKEQQEKLGELFEKLDFMQAKIPTEYYVQMFNELSAPLGIVINDSGNVNNSTIPGLDEESILTSPLLDTLLENKQFKEWFDQNHITVKKYNRETQSYDEVLQRTYQWNITKPIEQKYYETRPALKYSKREVKDEYKTGYNPTTKQVELKVGEQIDNKGNFLPDPSKEKSKNYRNEKYYDLINSNDAENQRLVKLLETYKKFTLDLQEGLPNSHKNYLDVPSIHKENREAGFSILRNFIKSPIQGASSVWSRIKEKWDKLGNFDYDEGAYTYNDPKFEGRYVKDFTKVAMKYGHTLPEDQTSYDFARSFSKYNESANLYKELIKNLPVAKAIERISKSVESKGSFRRIAIQRIISNFWEGNTTNIELNLLFKNHPNSWFKKGLILIIDSLKAAGALMWLKLNPMGTAVNFAEGTTASIQKSTQAKSYNTLNFFKGSKLLAERFLLEWAQDWLKSSLTQQTLSTQLMTYFDFVQGESISKRIGERFSSNALTKTASLSPITESREFSEVLIAANQWLAMMDAIKVTQTLPNGETRNLPLYDAYELDSDGIIKLKDGISPEWDIHTNGSSFIRARANMQSVIADTQGNNSAQDKSFLESTTVGGIAFYMKKYFLYKFADAFAFNYSSNSTGLFSPRYQSRQGYKVGYTAGTLKVLFNILRGKYSGDGRLNIHKNLTEADKASLRQQASKLFLIMVPMLVLTVLLGYSGDDKNKKKNLENRSWLELNAMYLLDRLYVENKGLYSYKTYVNYVLEPSIKGVISDLMEPVSDLMNVLNKKGEYQKTIKTTQGKVIHHKGDKKIFNDLQKLMGINSAINMIEDPDLTLRNFDQQVNRTKN